MDPVTRLRASIDQTRPIVTAVEPDRLDSPSNCEDWDVRELANHLLGALAMFEGVGAQGVADMAVVESDLIGDDLAGSYDRLAAATLDAWSAQGRVDGTAKMPWGEMPADLAVQMLADDVLVHGWDLARSTGQQVDWDQELAEETLGFADAMFSSPEIRSGSFGDPLPVPDDADAMTRLVAFLGRTP